MHADGRQVGEGRIEPSIPYLISLDETLDVGTDTGTPVIDGDPGRGTRFGGTINWIQIDLESPDERYLERCLRFGTLVGAQGVSRHLMLALPLRPGIMVTDDLRMVQLHDPNGENPR